MTTNERIWRWLAYRLPRDVVYFATIRLWAEATTGKLKDVESPSVTVADALKAWESR